MTDILTRVFRTFTSQVDARKELKVTSITCSTLLVGEHSISRAVLLLAAVMGASQMGIRVVFFTQTQIQRLPASLRKCVPSLSPESLKKIRFFYPRTLEELLEQVAGLHESSSISPTPPSLIIVDGLDGYLRGPGGGTNSSFQPGELSGTAHLSGLLCDTAFFLTQLLMQHSAIPTPCQLIASFMSEMNTVQAVGEGPATDPVLDVLDRFFQIRCTLDQDENYEAPAAGLEKVWHIHISGAGIAPRAEWQLLIFLDGLMEFELV